MPLKEMHQPQPGLSLWPFADRQLPSSRSRDGWAWAFNLLWQEIIVAWVSTSENKSGWCFPAGVPQRQIHPLGWCQGRLSQAGAAGLHVSHLLSVSGFQNIQLVFSLRAQDGKVKKVQRDFLIMYARILGVGFCDISDSGDPKLTTLAYSPLTAAFKFKYILACPPGLSSMSFLLLKYDIMHRNIWSRSHQSKHSEWQVRSWVFGPFSSTKWGSRRQPSKVPSIRKAHLSWTAFTGSSHPRVLWSLSVLQVQIV